ncbi:MAG: metallophosphoesterase [Ruminococcaceae bacterium]|nr:metallophosphoesterase [Oscillospiraceae bacterium]
MSNNAAFYLITDSHLVSKNNWVEAKPISFKERGDQIALKATPEILDSFLDIIIADSQTDTVLFLGDNVNNGDMNSHADFKKRLARLTEAGKKVYVTYATHDYCGMGDDENFFEAVRFTESDTEPIEHMPKDRLFDFYYEYGPAQAKSVHRESGSYSVMLSDKVKLIAIIDNGNGRSFCGLSDSGVQWLESEIKSANKSDESVLLAVHHPVLPPWEIYRHAADFEMYGGYRRLYEIMCENSVKVVFTGHTHVQSIKRYEDENGRDFLDIATVALVNAAGKMRRVEIDGDSRLCRVSSIGIDKIKGIDTELSAYEYLYYLNFPGIWEKLIPLAVEDYDEFLKLAEGYLDETKLKKHKRLVRFAFKKARTLKLSTAAKLGGAWKKLDADEKKKAKNGKVIDCAFEIMRHIFTGNAPFTPDTAEYKILSSLVCKGEKLVRLFNIKKVIKYIPDGSSLKEIADEFLYNNRTGDDDSITFCLK